MSSHRPPPPSPVLCTLRPIDEKCCTSSFNGVPNMSWIGLLSFPQDSNMAVSNAEHCRVRSMILGHRTVWKRLMMVSLSPHSKCNSQRCASFLRSGSHSQQGGVCVWHTPVSIALMIGLVYKSRTSTSGNESGTALAREGFLEPRCPCALVRNSPCRSLHHVMRKSGSLSWVRD